MAAVVNMRTEFNYKKTGIEQEDQNRLYLTDSVDLGPAKANWLYVIVIGEKTPQHVPSYNVAHYQVSYITST